MPTQVLGYLFDLSNKLYGYRWNLCRYFEVKTFLVAVVNSQLPSAGNSFHLITMVRAGLAFRGNSRLSYLKNVCKLIENINNLNKYHCSNFLEFGFQNQQQI
jgi:hypothetical protein